MPAVTPPKRPSSAVNDGPAFVEQEWQKATRLGTDDADLEWAAAEGDGDSEEWECVACGKTFRSEAAWDSHERSKRHMQAVERLKLEMLEENEELDLDPPDGDQSQDEGVEQLDAEVGVSEKPSTIEQPVAEEDEETLPSRSKRKKKAKQKSRAPSPSPPPRTERRGKNRKQNLDIGVSGEDITGSQHQSPTPEPEAAQVEPGSTAGDEGNDGARPPVQPELSKREKRRAKEAAKKMQGGATPVKLVFGFIPYCNQFLLRVCLVTIIGLQCLFGRV